MPVGMALDITVRKRAENALKLQNELKSRFVSMASHEFRTPLATILMAADSLDAYFPKMKEVEIHQKLGRIKSNVDFLKKVMERVLDLSRIESGRMNMKTLRADFAGFLKKNVAEISRYKQTGHEINFNIENDRVECLFDPQMMKQVISNLLSNAIKYSGEGLTITVDLQHEERTIRFSVADQGIGISEDDAERIFDPFHRGGNVSNIRGTGLGLSLAREIVRLHGGDISFASREEGGTIFYVWFPSGL